MNCPKCNSTDVVPQDANDLSKVKCFTCGTHFLDESKAKKEKKEEKRLAKINEKGVFIFNDQRELAIAADIMIKTKQAPDHLAKDGIPAVAAGLMFCKQFNLPQKAMNQMGYIKGKLTQYGSLITAMAERHPKYGQKREFFVDDECNEICVKNKNLKATPYAAVVLIKKMGDEEWDETFFSIDDAKRAGLDTPKTGKGEINKSSPWIKYLKDMLMHKARKRALDSNYASAIEGTYYHEDMAEYLQQKARDVTSSLDDVKKDFESEENFKMESVIEDAEIIEEGEEDEQNED